MEHTLPQAKEAVNADLVDAECDEAYSDPGVEDNNNNAVHSEYIFETSYDEEEESSDDNDEVIYEAVTACLELFSHFARHEDASEAPGMSQKTARRRSTEITEFIEDMERSFNLWIDYTGALAADVDRSLDQRLQGYRDIQNMSLELLQMLSRSLEYLEATEKDDVSNLTSNGSQNEAVDSIRHAIEELHFMATIIRTSSVRSQNYNSSSGFGKHHEPYFENYVFLIIRQTFPHARRSLCKQLSESIALRRIRLHDMIKHEEKLKARRRASQVNNNSTYASSAAQPQPPRSQASPSATSPSSLFRAHGRGFPSKSIGTMSMLNPEMARLGLRVGPVLSTISMGSSVRQSDRKYPQPPQFQLGATDCACPYCARRLTTMKLRNIPAFWNDHLDEDVKPYICLSEECTSPLLFFVHMKEWVDHMNSMHSEQWPRKIHMSTWYCDTHHETEQFNDFESFVKHMKDPINHPDRPPPTTLQLDTLSRNKQKTLIRDSEYSCPFCDCIPYELRPIIPTSEPKAIRHKLHKHIANHLKGLAVLSVPVLTTMDTAESESSKSKADAPRLREGEEASYASGYDEELRLVPLSSDENPKFPPLTILETKNTHWHDTGFSKWYDTEGPGVNQPELETDPVLQEMLRVRERRPNYWQCCSCSNGWFSVALDDFCPSCGVAPCPDCRYAIEG